MKNKKIKKLISLLLIFSLLNPSALMAGGLQDMFSSNSTVGRKIDNGKRIGYYGGNLSMRDQIKTVNLFNYRPPHLSGGCSGADLFMGSFSFINADQIVSTIKAIMNNAQGLIFQAAIDFVSEKIGEEIKHWSHVLEKLNSMQMNSCNIATFATGLVAGHKSSYKEFLSNQLSMDGESSDWLAEKITGKATNAAKDTVEEHALMMGNVIWKGLNLHKSGSKHSFPMFTNPNTNAVSIEQWNDEIIMTFVGSFINTAKSPAAVADGTTNSAPVATGAAPIAGASAPVYTVTQQGVLSQPMKAENDPVEIYPLLNLDDLVESSGVIHYKYSCNTDTLGCSSAEIRSMDFVNLNDYISVMLYGDPSWLDQNLTPAVLKANLDAIVAFKNISASGNIPVHPASIIGLMINVKSSDVAAAKTFTAAQADFLDSTDLPILKLVKDLHGGELTKIPAIISPLRAYMLNKMMLKFTQTIISSLKEINNEHETDAGKAAGAKAAIELTPRLQDRMDYFVLAEDTYLRASNDSAKLLADAQKAVDIIIKDRPAHLLR
jgi:hypothetical protein